MRDEPQDVKQGWFAGVHADIGGGTKAATWLADIVVAEFGLKNASVLFILATMSLFLVVIHLGFASATALASAMIPIVIAVLKGMATPGINIIGMTMLLQFVVSFGFILVVNAPQNMVAYGTETFNPATSCAPASC